MRQLAGIAKERKSESECNERTNSSLAVWTEHANKNQVSGICKSRDKRCKEIELTQTFICHMGGYELDGSRNSV